MHLGGSQTYFECSYSNYIRLRPDLACSCYLPSNNKVSENADKKRETNYVAIIGLKACQASTLFSRPGSLLAHQPSS
eukprot:scaffold113675_cov52-Prasinocladus_malaysianus.AAC.1